MPSNQSQRVGDLAADAFPVAGLDGLFGDELGADARRHHTSLEPGVDALRRWLDAAGRHDARPGAGRQDRFDKIGAAHGFAGEDLDDLHAEFFSLRDFGSRCAAWAVGDLAAIAKARYLRVQVGPDHKAHPRCHIERRGRGIHNRSHPEDQVGQLLVRPAADLLEDKGCMVAAVRELKEPRPAGVTGFDHLLDDFGVAVIEDGHQALGNDCVEHVETQKT